jgi:hypothetical protein
VRNADAGNAVVPQSGGLRQSGPHINHVGHDGVPLKIPGGADGRFEGLGVVVRHLLAGEAGMACRELGDKGADGHAIGFLVAQGRDVAAEAFLVKLLGVHFRKVRCAGQWTANLNGGT